MLRGPKTSYEYFKKNPASFLFLCQLRISLCFLKSCCCERVFWDPRVGWGVVGWLYLHPCPAQGVWACGDVVLYWLCSGAQDTQTICLLAPTKAPRNRRVVVKTQMQRESAFLSSASCMALSALRVTWSPSAKGHHVAAAPQKPPFSFALLYSLRNCYFKMKQNEKQVVLLTVFCFSSLSCPYLFLPLPFIPL